MSDDEERPPCEDDLTQADFAFQHFLATRDPVSVMYDREATLSPDEKAILRAARQSRQAQQFRHDMIRASGGFIDPNP